MLPCEWHHGTFQFIRSQKSLQLERDRQVQLGTWLIWHPYSPIKFYWDCFMMIISYSSLLYIPVGVFYICKYPKLQNYLNTLGCVVSQEAVTGDRTR